MGEKSTEERFGSRGIWESLEELARQRIQEFVQELLEEEVTALVGRKKSERRPLLGEGATVYRNGYGKPRRLSMSCGTVEVRRPRVRGLEERFESQVLPLFKRRSEQIGELFPQLYLHGLAQGDFELVLRGLLGNGPPLSASSNERLRGKWVAEYEAWRRRSLSGLEPVYLWADAGKRFKKVVNATALIWRLLMVAERTFRRLDHPELLPEVAMGAPFVDGVRVLDEEPQLVDAEAVA